MKRVRLLSLFTVLLFALAFGDVSSVMAQDVFSGDDCLSIQAGPQSYFEFGGGPECPPLPADFFGPGSDPFDGRIDCKGEPLEIQPPGPLGLTSMVIRRNEDATLPACGNSDIVEIEVVALRLVSTEPITVTYNGGLDPELWDVMICLSEEATQSPGSMDILYGCLDNGGLFTSTLPVMPKFIFTKVIDPIQQRVLDYGLEGLPPVIYQVDDGYWCYEDHGYNIISSPGDVWIDHDCSDGTPDIMVGPGSNYFPGLQGTACNCSAPPDIFDIVPTVWNSNCGQLTSMPPIMAEPILPGVDLFVTPVDFGTHIDFSEPDGCSPLPADYFGPGSDPFDGVVAMQGSPLETMPPDVLGNTDTIIRRTQPGFLGSCPSSAMVEIEIVALSLVSTEPITVTYNGGQDPESWDVQMCLSSYYEQPPGWMNIFYECLNSGGHFEAFLPVIPRLVFTNIADPSRQIVWDPGLEDVPTYVIVGDWSFADHGFGIINSPGGVLVDHDCDPATPEITVDAGSNFYSGVNCLPCNCIDPPSQYQMEETILNYSCVTQAVFPAIGAEAIPTLSEWGLIILALVVMALGTIAVIRKRNAANEEAGKSIS